MLKKVMVIGSGPIVIGQAAEFDYSGTQACKVLKDEGIEVVLVNNNPATIMTDQKMADCVYSEPLTIEFLERIIIKERPEALIAGMGGQTALNLSMALYNEGILDKHNVQVIGTNIDSIENAEDREKFKNLMLSINQPCVDSYVVENIEDAIKCIEIIGYPVVVRPAFTLGGTGGGFCYSEEDLIEFVSKGVQASIASQVLIERSIKGWKEIEYEMIRDHKGNTIVVCNMENFDPVGVHTGDSIVVAPSQTLSDQEYQMLRRASIDIVSALDIIGGCNVQLALDPNSLDYYVIEVNPRVSRSSALASKATGYPIAKVATKIALGYALDEITNDVTKKTKACFEPVLDYCALKIPKWPFNKFKDAKRELGTQMKATGEVMSIANNFEAALLKGIRSLEISQDGLLNEKIHNMLMDDLFENVMKATDERLFYLAELIRREVGILLLNKMTAVDLFFLRKLKRIVDLEKELSQSKLDYLKDERLKELKQIGFSDAHISTLLLDSQEADVKRRRVSLGITPVYKMVDTCAGEFEAYSPYYYSTYDKRCETKVSQQKKILIVGSGPISIGQGVEFDYCSVHGVLAAKDAGYEALLINNNPETVSTDFDISDRLYFEPISYEEVMNVIELEKPEGVILQYGGQTAIKLAKQLHESGVKILGTDFAGIDLAEDRFSFIELLRGNNIKHPIGEVAYSKEEALVLSDKIEFPLLVRPSYVIGGEGMKVVHSIVELEKHLEQLNVTQGVLLDEYLEGIEIEVDCITDGKDILIPGIMEHLELSGVHSGDSISIYPPQSFDSNQLDELAEITFKVCKSMNAVGMINIQFIYTKNNFYIIEVNPRASRTVPFLSKVTNTPMIEIATQVMLGRSLNELGYTERLMKAKDIVAVKIPVFSMEKIQGAEMALSPEMKSTGEMMSIDYTLEQAMLKSLIAQGYHLDKKKVLISINDMNKHKIERLTKNLFDLGYELHATQGTYDHLLTFGIEAKLVSKISESDDIMDLIRSGELDMVINMPNKGFDAKSDGFQIRRESIERRIPCYTSLETVNTVVDALMLPKVESNIFDMCQL